MKKPPADEESIATEAVVESEDDISSEFTVSSFGSSKRKAFSDNDLKVFTTEECCHIINSTEPIISSEIRRLFQTNRRLIPLYEKFGFLSLKTKMRTERNKSTRK